METENGKIVKTGKIADWLTPDGLFYIQSWARDGMTESEIAKRCGCTKETFSRWKAENKEIKEAVQHGRQYVDYQVENALLKIALGYTTTEGKVVTEISPDGKAKNIRTEQINKSYAPNFSAIAMWLNNRRPEQWKKNREEAAIPEDDRHITVNIKKHTGKNKEEWTINAKPKKEELTDEYTEEELYGDEWEEAELEG